MANITNEQDRLIEEWAAEMNSHVGELKVQPYGEYPPDTTCWYGSLENSLVTEDLIRHFADASGDRNPLWRDPEYARKTRWGGIIAPPTFTDTIVQPYGGNWDWGTQYSSKFKSFFMLPDGATRNLYQPLHPRDKLRSIEYYLGVTEVKPLRPAPAREFVDARRRVLINQREEIVAILDQHFKAVINHNISADSPYWIKRRKRKLTDAERDAIQHYYDTETRRGAAPLYWEDVNVADILNDVLVGPIAIQDTFAAYIVMSGHAVGFDLEWERVKKNFNFHYLDPDINAWTAGAVCHVLDDKSHAFIWDGGAAVSFFFIPEWMLSRMIVNWMGDNGFLRKLDDRCDPYYPIIGDVLHTKGSVTNKYIKNDEYLVDLKVNCENQDKLIIMSGTATVKLPSKNDFRNIKQTQLTCKTPVI